MSDGESVAIAAKLQQKITNLMESMSLLEGFLSKFDPEVHQNQVSVRLAKLEEHFASFFDVAAELESMSTEKFPITLQKQRFSFESKYYSLKAILISKLPEPNTSQNNTPTAAFGGTTSSVVSHLRYPELRLLEFSGCPEHWVSFRDSFTTGVMNRMEIQDVDKMQYLKGLVHGEAARMIGHIEVSEGGFKMAWKLLKQRYDSKRRLIFCHLEGLYDTVPMQSECREELLRLIDSFEEHIANLKRLGEPTELWSSSLVYHLYSRLDENTRREWDKHLNAMDFKEAAQSDQNESTDEAELHGQRFPEYSEIVRFLQGYAKILPSASQLRYNSRRPAHETQR